MQVLALDNSINEDTDGKVSKDQQINLLFHGPHRKIIQITLRNQAILAAHKAAAPITIHSIAGRGILKSDGGESIELSPGTLVTLEPNVTHSVEAHPAVSILVSQFT